MDGGGTAHLMTNSERVLADHREFLFPAVRPLYDEPLVFDEGEGAGEPFSVRSDTTEPSISADCPRFKANPFPLRTPTRCLGSKPSA